MTYLFCAYRDWAKELYKLLSKRHKNMILIKNPKQLTVNYVEKINPKFTSCRRPAPNETRQSKSSIHWTRFFDESIE